MRRIVICEDVEIQREMLKEILTSYFEEINEEVMILTYDSGESLVADIEEEYVEAELILLDIYMKKLNGMETAKKLRDLNCNAPIVFLTASPDFAVESYDVQAAGYLLKPFEEDKLKNLLNHILKVDLKRRVVIKERRQYRYPYIDDILYMESDRHVVTIHMRDGSSILTQEKMRDLKSRIGQKRFLHCHQSYLVNMDYIRDVEEEFVLADNSRIPIRVRGRKQVLEEYDQYFHEDCAQKRAENAREKKKEKRML